MNKKGFLSKMLGKNNDGKEESYNTLNPTERDMIRGVVELSDKMVKEVIVPRIDVVFVSADTPFSELIQIIIDCGHSRVPVYEETIDNVIGVLYVKDLLVNIVKDEEIKIRKIIRKPYFVPESKRLDSLLREFKRKRVHIAVAVDEYGGVSGIVCMEDIIEEIVGDIQDEFDNEVEDILKIGNDIFLCDARVGIEELNEQTGLNISDENFDTFGGLVFDLFGKIPVKYEKVSYYENDFIIQDMDGHKIKTIKLVINRNNSEDS